MKKKRVVAFVTTVIMVCSLFMGFTVAAADANASVKLEVYRAVNKDFGAKMDLSKDKLNVGDEILVAVQVYGFDKLLQPGGLDAVTLGVNYDSSCLKQSMNTLDDAGIANGASINITAKQYEKLKYVANNSTLLDDPSAEYSTDPEAFDKELYWPWKTTATGDSAYSPQNIQIQNNENNTIRYIKLAIVSGGAYFDNGTLNALVAPDGSSKKMLCAFMFQVKSIPEARNTTISLDTSKDSALKIDTRTAATDDGQVVGQGYNVLTGRQQNVVTGETKRIMEDIVPITVNFDLPATDAPTGTLTTYADGKRTVNVTSAVADTTIKVYADANKTKLIATGTKGSNSVEVARASAAGDSDVVKALNLGKVWITATKDGMGESNATALTAAARPNETKLTAAPTIPGSFSVKVNGAVTSAGLPSKVRVPFTYNASTGVETGAIEGDMPVTWAWTTQPTTAGVNAVAKATWGNAPSGFTKQADIDTYAPSVNVSVQNLAVESVTPSQAKVEMTAQAAFTAGMTNEAGVKKYLDDNVKVSVKNEGAAAGAPQATTWTKKTGDFNVKGATYTYESADFGGKKATVTVTVTPVKGQLGPRAKDATIEVTALDENLNKVERPTTNEALIALMPTKAFVNYGDAASPSQGEADLSWTVKSLSSETGALTDGDIMGTLIRTVTLPADLAWLTVDTNPAPDEVTVKASLELGGVRATAANMPGTDNDMIRVTSKNQQIGIMANLVKKAGAIIEVYDSKEATTPSITHTVTEEEATAQQALFTTDNFRTAGSTRYVGINYGGMKTPNESRLEMAVSAEPAVTLTGTATSVKEGATITETAQLNGTWTFVADSQTWASSADATLTATANTDKSTAAIKGIAAGTATVTFTAKVAHPFAEELLAADPDATNTEVEVTATKAYSVTKKATPPAPSNPTTPGTRPGTSGNHGIGGVVIVPSQKQYFIDIDNITWAKDKINALAEKGIVEGVADKIFAPNNTVTRAEFAKMIVGAFGIYDTNATMNFADTVGAENEWYYKYVASAAKRGIILGYEEDNTFRPTRTISREEMCAIVVRACKATGRTLVRKHQPITFNDDASIMGYAKESVDLMTSAGIIDGMGENMFVPKGSATRAQAAKIIYDVTIG